MADINDLIPLKKTLNKVGYYKKPDWGYTDAVDERLLSAITDFQKDHNLVPDGIMKPGGPTEEKLQQVAADADRPKTPTGTQKYIWRTIGDNKVRSKHADRNGKVFDWDNPPEGGHPGEDYNCRCWAEDVEDEIDKRCFLIAETYNRFAEVVPQYQEELNELEAKEQELEEELERIRNGGALIDSIGSIDWGRRRQGRRRKPDLSPPNTSEFQAQKIEAELIELRQDKAKVEHKLQRAKENLADAEKDLAVSYCRFGWSSDGVFPY